MKRLRGAHPVKKVLVLGGSGMLGAMVTDFLSRGGEFQVTATVRDGRLAERCAARIPGAGWRLFDAEGGDPELELLLSEPYDWIVNAIGVIKPYIRDDDPVSVERAIRVNALFPHLLAKALGGERPRVLQIATDCVYSGIAGNYPEDAPHDPYDVYGKTKSLGEAQSAGVRHIRCSIIGPEPKGHVSLLDWFRGRPRDAEVTGFTNHRWNGVTTLHFAKVCAGIVREEPDLPSRVHLVPSDDLTKAEMLEAFSAVYGRGDVSVKRGSARTVIDRRLSTAYPEVNGALWLAAGYPEPPTVKGMIEELGKYPFRLESLDGETR